jgi:hypothetical protein
MDDPPQPPLERGESNKVPLFKGDLGGYEFYFTFMDHPPQPPLERGESNKVPLFKGDLGGSEFYFTFMDDPPQPPLERGESSWSHLIDNPPQPPLERGEFNKVPLFKGDLGGSEFYFTVLKNAIFYPP